MALKCGISPLLFDDLSIGEVVDMINAYNSNKVEDLKLEVKMKQIQAIQIMENIAVLIDKSNVDKVTPIWDFYPQLFRAEKSTHDALQNEDELELAKSRRRKFAEARNSKIGGDGT